MKQFLLAVLLLTTQLHAAPVLTYSTGAYEIDRSSAVSRKYHAGTALANAGQFGVRGQWDYAVSGGAANSLYELKDSNGLKVSLPSGAIITNCLIDVVTQPASSTGSASLAFGSKAVADLKASAFVAAYTTTLPLACIPTGTQATMIKLSSEGRLIVTTGSEALTAGKINVWVEYVLSGSN